MASKRSPSGLPRGRIVRQVYGPAEIDLDGRVGNQHEGFKRVRRSLLGWAVAVALLAGVVALTGNTATASGIAILLLAPLALVLAGLQVAIAVTEPRRARHRGG